ncbi:MULTISPECIES: BfmA/BtgA family mobilization protein [Rufibacter]|uniref:Uncharacterized protein n=1 Tax=Rufibacter quisquiliarum TaxID=1549639 RepID=A0A839GWL3_9BACT|nr:MULTISPECIES: BfmA/BtgA family mobilization protein [Rufibacter]MBA9079136.1 hypothetical protein [Rufibacter quisquiliarum]
MSKLEKTSTTSARLNAVTHHLLAKEAKRLGLSAIDYLDAAVNYFGTRGLNPVEIEAREGALIMQDIKRLGDRIFGYMQEQERGLLSVMLEELIRSRVTIDRVLRMEEIVLSTYKDEELRNGKSKLKALREQNEGAITNQLKLIFDSTKEIAPGKKKKSEQPKADT